MNDMLDLDALYDIASDRDIIVVNSSLTENKKAASISAPDIDVIVLDRKRIRSRREERMLVAEEVALHITGAMQLITSTLNSPVERLTRFKIENKARRCALQLVIPFDELCKQIPKHSYDGELDIYELSEFFDVDAPYILYAIDTYITMGMMSPKGCI